MWIAFIMSIISVLLAITTIPEGSYGTAYVSNYFIAMGFLWTIAAVIALLQRLDDFRRPKQVPKVRTKPVPEQTPEPAPKEVVRVKKQIPNRPLKPSELGEYIDGDEPVSMGSYDLGKVKDWSRD